jgi:hypothetical protein
MEKEKQELPEGPYWKKFSVEIDKLPIHWRTMPVILEVLYDKDDNPVELKRKRKFRGRRFLARIVSERPCFIHETSSGIGVVEVNTPTPKLRSTIEASDSHIRSHRRRAYPEKIKVIAGRKNSSTA